MSDFDEYGYPIHHGISDEPPEDHFRRRIATLKSQLAEAKGEAERERELRMRLYEDGMIAHRWFAEQFGPEMNGRDFAVKCPMASDQLAAANERAAVAERVIHRLLSAVEYPPNGHHHCRWCRAGTNNNWQHDEGCAYVSQTVAIDKARDEGRAFLAQSAPAPAAKESEASDGE